MTDGVVNSFGKTSLFHVWPVRLGQVEELDDVDDVGDKSFTFNCGHNFEESSIPGL